MAERGQRTTLRFGSVSAEVSLLKTSGKPKSAQHETRRVRVSPAEIAAQERAAAEAMPVADPLGGDEDFLPPTREPVRDDFAGASFAIAEEPEEFDVPLPPLPESAYPAGAEPLPAPVVADRRGVEHFPAPDTTAHGLPSAVEHARTLAEPLADDPRSGPAIAAPELPAAAPYVPPVTRVEQGVYTEAGEWIDLTERLEEADRRTKVDGIEVAGAVHTNAIARERVRDAHYVAGVFPDEYKVLKLLWIGLRETNRAAAVRWTKKTAQALGFIVARGELRSKTNPACLVLLELEWADNMRPPGPRVRGPLLADVDGSEARAAIELVEAFAGPPSLVNDLRDSRLAARAELLQLARDGKLAEYVPPAEPMPEDVADEGMDLAAALAASSAWIRAHVPA